MARRRSNKRQSKESPLHKLTERPIRKCRLKQVNVNVVKAVKKGIEKSGVTFEGNNNFMTRFPYNQQKTHKRKFVEVDVVKTANRNILNNTEVQQNLSYTRLPARTERIVTYKPGDTLNISVTKFVADTHDINNQLSDVPEAVLPESTLKVTKADDGKKVPHIPTPSRCLITGVSDMNSNCINDTLSSDYITIPDDSDVDEECKKQRYQESPIKDLFNMSTLIVDRTLNDIYQTVDATGSDNETNKSDKMTITDSDNDLIYIDTTVIEESNTNPVIIIDDDTPQKFTPAVASTPAKHVNSKGSRRSKYVASPSSARPFKVATNVNITRSSKSHSLAGMLKAQALQLQEEICPTAPIIGRNFLNANNVRLTGLRPVFIDGSNVAMGHSRGQYFSVKGLKLCIDYFKMRGHQVTAIVPNFRKARNQNSDPKLLDTMEINGTVIFTPSRKVNGKNIIPYDDRYIVLLAHVHKGIIVSADNYRDLLEENPEWLDVIQNRLLTPTWVDDMVIFPSDPLGRFGPTLDEFLRFPN